MQSFTKGICAKYFTNQTYMNNKKRKRSLRIKKDKRRDCYNKKNRKKGLRKIEKKGKDYIYL